MEGRFQGGRGKEFSFLKEPGKVRVTRLWVLNEGGGARLGR